MLLTVYGKTGSGKDYVVDQLVNLMGLKTIVRATTRPIRDSETDGEKYNFISEEDFSKEDFIFSYEFRGWKYGVYKETLKESISSNDIYVIIGDKEMSLDISVFALKSKLSKNLVVMEVEADEAIRHKRLIDRDGKENESETNRRISSDNRDYAEIDFYFPRVSIDNSGNFPIDIMVSAIVQEFSNANI